MALKKDSKAEAVRQYLSEHKSVKPAKVVAALAEQDIKIGPGYVRTIRSAMKARSARKKRSSQSIERRSEKGLPWTFPKNTLEDAIRIAKAIEEKNAGNPMRAADLTKAVGFKRANDWRFLDLLRSANQYGLVEGVGKTAIASLQKLGQDVVAPSSPKERQDALLAAFRNVPDFKAVADFYGNKKIPEDEFFLNTLAREFGIPRDRVEAFSEVFVANLEYLRAFDIVKPDTASGTGSLRHVGTSKEDEPVAERRVSQQPRVREFLDTCFVMMPFGEWFDRYYQEIYVPAIRDAGFEPVRADELFTTGTVVEQIWEQVKKAKILFADLTGRNANVFYELGLAHAARKPVVFAVPTLDDVPFDLRHLRVIEYEIREPGWAAKLQKNVTDYLKNTLKDPTKSIPHPFRTQEDEDEEE